MWDREYTPPNLLHTILLHTAFMCGAQRLPDLSFIPTENQSNVYVGPHMAPCNS